jgi:hypothetical protein
VTVSHRPCAPNPAPAAATSVRARRPALALALLCGAGITQEGTMNKPSLVTMLALPFVFAAVPTLAFADNDERLPDDLPTAIDVPAGQKLTFEALGVGVQIYRCGATPAGGFAWTFVAPEATLYAGEVAEGDGVAHHFAGPTWEANNGGRVVGSAIGRATVDPTAIPWLLLKAVAHDGPGLFSEVTYIQRLDTVGGKAPASGCDASALGTLANVPYQAHYLFYKPESADK